MAKLQSPIGASVAEFFICSRARSASAIREDKRSCDCRRTRLCRCSDCGSDDERVKALVYVAALAPEEGETVAQVFYRDAHPQAPKLAPDRDGWIWMPEEGFSRAFAHHATADQIAVSKAVQRPIALKCIQEPAPKPAWRSKPSWFLIAEEDRMINPKTQHFMANRMRARTHTFAVDHAPLLTAPEKVLQVIIGAAQETLS
jgi:pimeloyl-ACP methyl ester carboxylesterase